MNNYTIDTTKHNVWEDNEVVQEANNESTFDNFQETIEMQINNYKIKHREKYTT